MSLNKSTSYTLINILNGLSSAVVISKQDGAPDIRSIQRALQHLTDLNLANKTGPSNNPQYSPVYNEILKMNIPQKVFDNESRPISHYRFDLIEWLEKQPVEELENMVKKKPFNLDQTYNNMSAKDLEYLTIELSWKSSALEGNTYTLLDTQLLLTEGIKPKNRTEFETQMIINHKDAISFIVENRQIFRGIIDFKTIEELHKIIGNNLGIDSGVRKKLVRISASNYEPLSNPQIIREQAEKMLTIINSLKSPYVRALLSLSLIPYLQIFEDGNKRTGRILANAILISSVGQGFSLRKTEARSLAIAYLSFYEFSSLESLDKILAKEILQN